MKEEKGVCYLYVKTAERAQKPKDLWEKIPLDKNYNKVTPFQYLEALEQVDATLKYWNKFSIHKSK